MSEVFSEMASIMLTLDNITWEPVAREGHVTYPVDRPDVPDRDVTNPKLDPFAKIPEFKFCAAKVERVEPVREAAE